MRLFITGCTGFLGRVCLEKLAASPEIERLYLLIHKTPQEFYHPKITAIPGDVLDLGNIRLDEAVDACLLLAGAINGRASSKETYSVNFSGTESAITFCRNNNIPRIILTSSVNVRLPHLGASSHSRLWSPSTVCPWTSDHRCGSPQTQAYKQSRATDTTHNHAPSCFFPLWSSCSRCDIPLPSTQAE